MTNQTPPMNTPVVSQLDENSISIPSNVQEGSQTQAETQLMLETQPEDLEPDSRIKRKTTASSDEGSRMTKKVKISIGPAVDLGD